MRLTEGGGIFYFTGQRGTGKSTELRRLRVLLQPHGFRVVLVDMASYVRENQPVDLASLLIAVVGALTDAVEAADDLRVDFAKEPLWTRLWNFLQTEVKVESIEVGRRRLQG